MRKCGENNPAPIGSGSWLEVVGNRLPSTLPLRKVIPIKSCTHSSFLGTRKYVTNKLTPGADGRCLRVVENGLPSIVLRRSGSGCHYKKNYTS